MVFLSDLRGKKLSLTLSFLAALVFLMQGFDQDLVNGIITLDTWVKTFPEIDTVNTTGATKDHNARIQGLAVGVFDIGCAFGAVSLGLLGNRFGRRKNIFFGTIITIVGIVLQASSYSLAQLIISRFINGFGIGGITATVPMWVAECTKASERGRLVMLQGFLAIGGSVLVLWIEFGMYYVKTSSVNFRFPISFQLIFAVVIVSCIFFMPESPRWLISQDRFEEARLALARLGDVEPTDQSVSDEIAVMRHTLVEEMQAHDSPSPFARTHNRHLHRTVLAVAINMFAQMSGVSVIAFYSTTIFEQDLGFSGSLSRAVTGCLETWQFLASGLSVLVVDRFGRRPLLLLSATGMLIAQFALAGLSSDLTNKSMASASVFFFFFAFFFFPIGYFMMPFMYAAEIAPLRTRAAVTGMATATNWIFSFAVAEISPIAFANIGWKYYFVYGCIDALAIVMLYLFYPETKGRTLEDIDEFFIQSRSIFDTVKVARDMPIGDVITMGKLSEGQNKEAAVQQVEAAT
ncbi:General substrate transporter [Niveomyces insectorum RCEF 264]|uniref:General substrate transporter n=1 Tax=Niveomyces insectorum RCEF 264 TaxID=1081102 RepID=A0A162MKR9_9HYPO|nr:General substrate transporter [Niveomyces insectorum RCEF 264]